jgi:hypothetical protein
MPSAFVPRLRLLIKAAAARRPAVLLLPILPLYASIPLLFDPGRNPGDEPVYLYYAHNLLHGHYAEPPGWAWITHGPGLPVILTPFVAVHAPILLTRILVGPVVLFCAVLVFFKIADMLLHRTGALVCASLFAAYWPFLPLLKYVGNEPLCVLLIVALAHRLVVWSRSHRRRDVVIAGVILGCLTLVRVEYGYLLVAWIVIAGALLALRRRGDVVRCVLAASLLALVLCVPYLVYTQSVTNRFFYWSGSGAQQLYWMDTGRSQDYGDWQSVQDVFSTSKLSALRPVFRKIEANPAKDWDSELMNVAIRNIRRHPFLYIRNLVLNASRMVLNVPLSDTPVKLKSLLFYGLANLAFIAAAAVSLLAMRRRRQPLPPAPLLLVWFSVSTFVLHTLVAAYPAYFVLVVPALAVVALYGARFTLVSPKPLNDVTATGEPVAEGAR